MPVPRVGRCATCGRQTPGTLKLDSLRECEGSCPRCDASPFYLDNIAAYTGNVGRMTYHQVQDFLVGVSDPAEIEVCFRLEVIGHPPAGRREVLELLYAYYWEIAFLDDPEMRGKILSLDDALLAWQIDLREPRNWRYYSGLVKVPNAEAVI